MNDDPSMTGPAIGSIKARDEISEVVVFSFSSSYSSCSCSSSSGEDKTFRTRLLDTFVLVFIGDDDRQECSISPSVKC